MTKEQGYQRHTSIPQGHAAWKVSKLHSVKVIRESQNTILYKKPITF
jgi:hypothetical protein